MKRLARIAAVAAAVLLAWGLLRPFFRAAAPAPSVAALEQARRVRILRDRFGVPHVFGHTDADAAFGLAYAHAEDDWPTIQGLLAAARGRLSLLQLSKTALANDYYVELVRVRDQVEEQYGQYGDDFRAVLESYAEGLNLYAALHPSEADARLLPLQGKDIAAGFAHKIPIMLGLPRALTSVDGQHAGDRLALVDGGSEFPGSNAHAVAASRAADGVTRLNVNSHQPWEGPVTWYEAHVHSEQGWNMTGGTFPGAPFLLHGHNDHLGWAHTVNAPHAIDVYELQIDPSQPRRYRFEGGFRELEEREGRIEVDIGIATLPLHKKAFWSVHGPVLKTGQGTYAFRYAGIGRALRAAEQWFRMNKAGSLSEWKAAMEMQGIPMFNTVYADRDNIFYVYNALLPVRRDQRDPGRVLPGDREDAIWNEYLAFAKLPQVHNPPSGFVFNCNATPFRSTAGEGNPDPALFPESDGIERTMNNRSRRSLALFGGAEKISGGDFLRFKFDRTYDRSSRMFKAVIDPLLRSFTPRTEAERQGLDLLRSWDGVADESSRAAALAILTFKPLAGDAKTEWDEQFADPERALREAIQFLEEHYGHLDVPLGEVQRLRRGSLDLPLGGGPDVLNAAYTRKVGGHLVGTQGDSYILIAEFGRDGVASRSIHQYGSSNRPRSTHYADQAALFVRRELKPALRTESEIRAQLEREYAPGEEPGARPP